MSTINLSRPKNRLDDFVVYKYYCNIEQIIHKRAHPSPRPGGVTYLQPKLRRCATSILLASPDISIRLELGLEPVLSIRYPPPASSWLRMGDWAPRLHSGYSQRSFTVRCWSGSLEACRRRAALVFETEPPELDTESDGTRLSWATQLSQHVVVFYAHPRHHQYAWTVRSLMVPYVRKSIDRWFSSTNSWLPSHWSHWWSDWIRL